MVTDDCKQFSWENSAWRVLKSMMKEKSFLIQHQIGTFNDFLDKGLRNVIEQFNPIILNYDFAAQQKFAGLRKILNSLIQINGKRMQRIIGLSIEN